MVNYRPRRNAFSCAGPWLAKMMNNLGSTKKRTLCCCKTTLTNTHATLRTSPRMSVFAPKVSMIMNAQQQCIRSALSISQNQLFTLDALKRKTQSTICIQSKAMIPASF
jgi:hypothetical protein